MAISAIATLDPIDRSILHLTLVEGLKPGVIATRMGMSSDVVRQRKVRATRKLMEFVQNQSQNDFPTHSIAGNKP